jgi:GNAT superfamily N-acetyltransferase
VTIPILPAAPVEISALAGVLAWAFAADPMVVWPMVTDDNLEVRIGRSFELVDALYAAEGWIHRTEDGLGVMSLIPPGGGDHAQEIDLAVAGAMAAITPDSGERYARFWAWIEACLPGERHWLLDQLAVEPRAQGRGIGTALFRFAMTRSGDDSLPLFLETGVARNVTFYERFGFGVISEGDAPGGGPHVWFMRWGPRELPGRPALPAVVVSSGPPGALRVVP